ncbi:hypothetical protein IFR05_016903, partial [Cadophora sp. M221]
MARPANIAEGEMKLSYDNFFEWELDQEQRLSGAGRNTEARKIIVNSLTPPIFAKYKDIVKVGDTEALWNAIAVGEGVTIPGGTRYQNIRDELFKAAYEPAT